MKLFIASDLHGSAYWCRAMLAALEREGADTLLLLGDLLYHGPRNPLPRDYAPQEVAALLNARAERILCVRGNCEAEVDQLLLRFPVLSDSCLLFREGRCLYCEHGHRLRKEAPPALRPGDLLLCGHTHVPVAEDWPGGLLLLNPGSVALPKNGTPHSAMTLEGDTLRWLDLETAAVTRTLRLKADP